MRSQAMFAQECIILAGNYYCFSYFFNTDHIDRRRIYKNLLKNFKWVRWVILCLRIPVLNFNNAGWPLTGQAVNKISANYCTWCMMWMKTKSKCRLNNDTINHSLREVYGILIVFLTLRLIKWLNHLTSIYIYVSLTNHSTFAYLQ